MYCNWHRYCTIKWFFFQTLKDETSSDGTLMDDGKLDTSFPLMFEKWVNTVKQQDLQPSEQYPQKALG